MVAQYFDYMKSNKDSLHNIIKKDIIVENNNHTFDILQDTIFRVNKIVIHTYNFIKLYILHLDSLKIQLPLIDRYFVQNVMKIVSYRNTSRGRKPKKNTLKLIEKLTVFYNNFYSKTLAKNDIVCDDNLNQILAYEAIDIVSNINTNIKEHYFDHIRKLINVTFGWKDKISEINKMKIEKDDKKKLKYNLYIEFQQIYNDVIDIFNGELTSKKRYHKWIKKNKYKIIPKKDSYRKKSINYDVCCNSQDYLSSMIFINKGIDDYNTKDNPIKLFNILPLRTSVIFDR